MTATSSHFKAIGKRIPKPDALPKVTGHTVYGHDLRLLEMLFGGLYDDRL